MNSGTQAVELRNALPAAEVLTRLGADVERGLGAAHVQARLALYGRNQLEAQRRRSVLSILAHQFASAIVALLAAAAVLSLAFGDWHEALAIIVVLLLTP
jgi:Ca2+-transporting ATPase